MMKPFQYLLWLAPFLILSCNNATAPKPTSTDTTAINDTGKAVVDTVRRNKNNHYSPPPPVPGTNSAENKKNLEQQKKLASKPKNLKRDTLPSPSQHPRKKNLPYWVIPILPI